MVKFDSFKTEYKYPQGAVRCLDDIRFCIRTDPSLEVEKVNLVIRNSDTSKTFVLTKKEDGDLFEGTAVFVETGMNYYRFELVQKKGTFIFVGTKDGHTASIGDWLPEWRVAAYDKDFHTSSGCEGAVMYQIFPDRFYRSEKVIAGQAKNERIIHESWDERPHCYYDYPDFKCNDFFMGNLKGIEEKLDYISSLGVTHIYLNPIFESSENHRYSTSDYMNIDPYLGTDSHFKELCEKAKEYDIKIILDGVFSHTGDDSIYFNRYHHFSGVGAHDGKDSPYYNWYNFTEFPEKYECWWGFDTLPNVCETNPGYMEYITGKNGVLRHWLRMGASGWRLDVADELPDKFLEAVRRAVKEENKDALIIGEVWENAITKVSYGAQRKFLLGKQCDTVMNYPFLNAITDFVIGADSAKFYNSIMQIINDYPAPSVDCLMNMLSTHDTARAICRMGADTIPERRYQADAKLTEFQLRRGIKRLKMAAVIQFTLPGIPCIYYGDEAGLQGFGDPSCRGTYPWGRENTELVRLHRSLGNIRKNNKSDFSKPIEFIKAEGGVISYSRGDLVITVNNSQTEADIPCGESLFGFNTQNGKLLPCGAIIQRR
ncbi:MAG: glycoside hydrolase family 13 protein [Clostridia bacterium]|nr:glycoside hydrolase family 13 protein [Clostridia bacterium]